MITCSLYMRTLGRVPSQWVIVRWDSEDITKATQGGFTDLIAFCLQRTSLKGSHAPDRVHSPFLCPAAGYGKKKWDQGWNTGFILEFAFGHCQIFLNRIGHGQYETGCGLFSFVLYMYFTFFNHFNTEKMKVYQCYMCWNIFLVFIKKIKVHFERNPPLLTFFFNSLAS